MMTNDNHREILIKNIPYDVDEETLLTWCSNFGPVTKCVLKRDQFGQSRGFAFVTYATVEGHDNILSRIPCYCYGRRLYIKSTNEQIPSTDDQFNSSTNHHSETILSNENFNSTTMDDSLIYDDENSDRLASLRDELEANLECMQIAHEHEIKLLRDKLAREKKLCNEAKISFQEAEEDWRKVNAENLRLRNSLIKNVMQTFNIRRDFARRTKEQLKNCQQIEKEVNSKAMT